MCSDSFCLSCWSAMYLCFMEWIAWCPSALPFRDSTLCGSELLAQLLVQEVCVVLGLQMREQESTPTSPGRWQGKADVMLSFVFQHVDLPHSLTATMLTHLSSTTCVLYSSPSISNPRCCILTRCDWSKETTSIFSVPSFLKPVFCLLIYLLKQEQHQSS